MKYRFVLFLGISLLLFGCKKTSDQNGGSKAAFENDSLSFEAGVKLSEDEIAFDKKLARLRKQIVEKAGEQSLDLNNKSFEEIKPFAESGKLYEILKRMPKGGLLHSHSGGLTDIKWVIETAKKYEECYVFLQSDGKDYIFGQLAFFKKGTAPQGFVSLRRKILEEPPFENKLYELLTLKRKTLCAQVNYWIEFEKRFRRIGLLLSYRPFFTAYYKKAMYDLTEDNIQHLEIRFFFGNLYDFQHGEYGAETAITDLEEILKEVQKTKQFSLKIIYTSFKFLDNKQIEEQLEKAFQLKKKFPEIISGFDLVADEASGNSISYFQESWSALSALSKKYGAEMPLFLHAGESNSVFNKNIEDVSLLNNRRVGHGLNLIYFPQAMNRIKQQNELVEVSPISNQTLGYVSDMRNHPARVLLRSGVQCSVNSDDPGVFGYEGLSYDFWMIVVYWELDLKALKKLVFNSLNYSSLNENEKQPALDYLEKEWLLFIEQANQKLD